MLMYAHTVQTNLAFLDLYAVLCIPRNAPLADVKQAYHRILLTSHPDKRSPEDDIAPPLDAALLQQAYLTLSNATARRAYDAQLVAQVTSGPRPAQVVSLEEFSVSTDDSGAENWMYACRCGGGYHIDDTQLEQDIHLIGCDACSEVIWVGYEAQDAEAEGVRH